MKPFDTKKPKLEKDHWAELKRLMESRDWLVMKVTGSMYMVGWPDVWACHKEFGQRWIETKRPVSGKLNDDQRRVFMKMHNHGAGIWILETKDDYPLLFEKPNWWKYTIKGFY